QLDNLLGDLQPGETRRELLRMTAVRPGVFQNVVRVVGDDGLAADHAVQVEVVSPELQVALQGPSKRFVERQATYEITLANVGAAAANNVQLAAQLDRGFEFISAENQGLYDASRHMVTWNLEQLPSGQQPKIALTLLPVQEGDQAIRLEARSDLSQAAIEETVVSVESLAELTFQIADTADPIELRGETTYEIRVQNSGSRTDTNVQMMLRLPVGMTVLAAEGDPVQDREGNVLFNPIGELAAGQEQVYRVRVQGVAPGRHLIQAIVKSDQSSVAVTKEESTMVYADN
ncbi:MAG: hypothetical protein AAF989_03575, partial [Planctomycetota bacterium]